MSSMSTKALEDINVSLIDALATITLINNYVKHLLHMFSFSRSHVYMSFK